jgi:hypothetical protein
MNALIQVKIKGDMPKFVIGHLLLLISVMQATGVVAQPSSELLPTQVLVNDVVATAGQEITLHMHFETRQSVKIRRLKVEITFPVPQLHLVRVERPYPMEKVEGQISVQEMEPGRLQVEIEVPEDSPEALPEEAVAFLVMQIAGDVEAVPLTIVVEKAEMRDLEGQTLKEVGNSQAQINVVSEELYPLISCFFYMH